MIEIIAEAGKNFIEEEKSNSVESCLRNAKLLAHAAKHAGADVVKFQCHVAEDELGKRADSRRAWIELNERLTPYNEFWVPLKEWCDKLGIEFLVTPMSRLAAIKMERLVDRWKVASPDIFDFELLEFLRDTEKPIILSSGMTTKRDQEDAVRFLGHDYDYKILHCVSEYPCPLEHANIYEVGYYNGLSDHTMSLITGALSVVLGAEIIEKHFTSGGIGRDAKVSLEPDQLKEYVQNVRDAELTTRSVERPTEKEKELLKSFYTRLAP